MRSKLDVYHLLTAAALILALTVSLIIYYGQHTSLAVQRQIGMLDQAQGNCRGAIAALKKVVSADGADVTAGETLGKCYEATDQYRLALALLSKIAKDYPSLETFQNLSSAATYAGQSVEAKAALNSAANSTSSPSEYLNLAQIARYDGYFTLSDTILSKVPPNLRGYQWYEILAYSQNGQGLDQAAIDSATSAVNLLPISSAASEMLFLSSLYAQDSQCTKAIKILITLLPYISNRTQVEIYSQIVTCAMNLGDKKQALQYAKKGAAIPIVIENATNHYQFLLLEAQIYSQMNDNPEAQQILRTIMASPAGPNQVKSSAKALLSSIA